MSYYYAKTIQAPFEDAVGRTRAALQAEGFGVITEIDVQKTLKTKINVDFRRYLILGACNPEMAHQALQIEDKVGTMLPCNVSYRRVRRERWRSRPSIRWPPCRPSRTVP